MTKEELEKEAEKHADGIYHYKINVSDYGEDGIINYRYNDVKEAYQKGAEPREKRIAELEKENAELKKEVEKHKWNDIFLEENAFYDKMIAEEYTTLQERIKQLEKENQDLRDNYEDFKAIAIPEREHLHNENAELKGLKDVATLIRANNDTVVTLMQLNNKLVSKNQQLTKAKEIIKSLLPMASNFVFGTLPKLDEEVQLYRQAEAFLNSEVEK